MNIGSTPAKASAKAKPKTVYVSQESDILGMFLIEPSLCNKDLLIPMMMSISDFKCTNGY